MREEFCTLLEQHSYSSDFGLCDCGYCPPESVWCTLHEWAEHVATLLVATVGGDGLATAGQ